MLEPKRDSRIPKNITLDKLMPEINGSIGAASVTERTFMIHVAGQSAAGKSTISSLVASAFTDCRVIDMDDYLRGWEIGPLNHDSGDPNRPFFAGLNPAVYNLEQLQSDLLQLRNRIAVEKPVFDEVTKSRVGSRQLQPADILVVDGIYALSSPFLELSDLGILVEAPLHDRLMRKIVRNHISYKQEVDGIVGDYLTRDEPTYAFYREELHAAADLVVENAANPAIDYHPLLQVRDVVHFGERNRATPKPGYGDLHPTENLSLASNSQGGIVLEYEVDNKLLVSGQILPSTYDLIQQFYDIEQD